MAKWIALDPTKHQKTDSIRLYRGNEQKSFSGLAIAIYDDSGNPEAEHYLFYCDSNWKAANDSLYSSVAEATEEAKRQFSVDPDEWNLRPIAAS